MPRPPSHTSALASPSAEHSTRGPSSYVAPSSVCWPKSPTFAPFILFLFTTSTTITITTNYSPARISQPIHSLSTCYRDPASLYADQPIPPTINLLRPHSIRLAFIFILLSTESASFCRRPPTMHPLIPNRLSSMPAPECGLQSTWRQDNKRTMLHASKDQQATIRYNEGLDTLRATTSRHTSHSGYHLLHTPALPSSRVSEPTTTIDNHPRDVHKHTARPTLSGHSAR